MQLSRRSFVTSAFAATGLAALPGCLSCCGSDTKTRLAVQLYSVRELIWQVGLPAVLADLKKMGYAGVEMAGYYTKDKKAITASELKKMLDDAGLVACGTHIGRDALAPENIGNTIDFNLTFGNNYLVCPGGGMRPGKDWKGTRDEWWEMIVKFYAKAGEMAAARGCKVGYHNHQWEHQEQTHGTSMWNYFFSNTPASVCMEQDVGWTVTAGGDPCEWFKKFPGRSPTIHAKEVFAKGAPGILGRPGNNADGTPRKGVDWDKLFVATDADNVQWYVVECETNPKTLESVRGSIWFLRSKGRC